MSYQAELRARTSLISSGALLVVAMFLASCGPNEVLYLDSTTRLAAPEILSSWSTDPFSNSKVVHLAQSTAAEILSDLRSRRPAPEGVLVTLPLTSEQIAPWQTEFPKTRFSLLRPLSEVNVPHFILPSVAAWKELARVAGSDAAKSPRAVAILPADTSPESIDALQLGWASSGQTDRIAVILWDTKLPPPDAPIRDAIQSATSDIFVLGVDPTRIAFPGADPKTRIHRDLGWTGAEEASGWCIRLAPGRLGTALHAAIRTNSPQIVNLPWEIVRKTPFTRS